MFATTSKCSQTFLIDNLVKQWAPLVWLAPGEKFLPLDVNEFLDNVHVHHERFNDELFENDAKWELHKNGRNGIVYTTKNNKRNWPAKQRSSNYLPANDLFHQIALGEFSERSYLVTNTDIDDLLDNQSSFLYGKDPNKFAVPIYAVVNICNMSKKNRKKNEAQIRQQFIPISRFDHNVRFSDIPVRIRVNKTYYMKVRMKRSTENQLIDKSEKEKTSEFMANVADNVKFSIGDIDDSMLNHINSDFSVETIPSFHVTYWMFYPYSQGKNMCTMNLGPLGRIPIPLIFGICVGSKKDYGSHVGDWEHMSLFFRGAIHPEAMYVSAHDAGAYYSYIHLTETFEFRSQETRKGILQRPNFPKTVITSSNHPILFAAMGSHGLWTAPGKHRFVRVPRLYDVNGFGTPWHTWKVVDITYNNLRSQSSIPPKWLQFKGKWGNPKSKCHPLRRVGLNFCEYTDGPTGIPLKQAHFKCSL